MVKEVLNRLNVNDLWDDKGDHQTILLKLSLIEFVCRFQSEECLNKASLLFNSIPKEYFTSPNDPKYNNT